MWYVCSTIHTAHKAATALIIVMGPSLVSVGDPRKCPTLSWFKAFHSAIVARWKQRHRGWDFMDFICDWHQHWEKSRRGVLRDLKRRRCPTTENTQGLRKWPQVACTGPGAQDKLRRSANNLAARRRPHDNRFRQTGKYRSRKYAPLARSWKLTAFAAFGFRRSTSQTGVSRECGQR